MKNEVLKPSKYLVRRLRQAEKDIKAGKNLSPLFTNMNKMDDYLATLKDGGGESRF